MEVGVEVDVGVNLDFFFIFLIFYKECQTKFKKSLDGKKRSIEKIRGLDLERKKIHVDLKTRHRYRGKIS